MDTRRATLAAYSFLYDRIARPALFSRSAQESHGKVMQILARLDRSDLAQSLFRTIHDQTFQPRRVEVGGVRLDHPLILAAGFVKGKGFSSDEEAIYHSLQGENLLPGWRTMPNLVGAVEFGSFTRHARMGNTVPTIWRMGDSRSLGNRVALANPGSYGIRHFFNEQEPEHAPKCFGISFAPTPDTDTTQMFDDAINTLIVLTLDPPYANWYTLNLSCPNGERVSPLEEDEGILSSLCSHLRKITDHVGASLWVKVSPRLSSARYSKLLRVFAESGVKAVVATNSIRMTDDGETFYAASGDALHMGAVESAKQLADQAAIHKWGVDIIGCGGVLDGQGYAEFSRQGIRAMQYYSALIYRGPLAAPLILQQFLDRHY